MSLSAVSGAIGRWYSIPLLLLVWHVAVVSGLTTSRLLPEPASVLIAFYHDVANGTLIAQAAVTLARALSGFVLGSVAGILLAVAMARVPLFSRLVEPLVFLGYPVPKIALYPVFIFIFGIGSSSKIAFTFFEVLYPVTVTTYLGLSSVPTRLIWTAKNYGASKLDIFWKVILPSVLPHVFTGCRIALPLAITIVVVTEMIGDSAGLGYYITIWGTRFNYANVYAGILMIGIIGFALDRLIVIARKHAVYWEKNNVRL